MAKHTLVVLANAVEGTDDQFNDWYNNTHLSDVLKLSGFVAAQRFALSGTQLGGGKAPYGYLALYEVETEDLETARAALSGGGDMYIDPSSTARRQTQVSHADHGASESCPHPRRLSASVVPNTEARLRGRGPAPGAPTRTLCCFAPVPPHVLMGLGRPARTGGPAQAGR